MDFNVIIEKGEKKLYATGVDYGALTPMLVEAIKEQQNIIQSQNETVNSLQVQINELREELCSKDSSYSWC